MMKKSFLIVIACVFGLLTAVIAQPQQPQQQQLAEVLVLPFANETKKKEYDWLSKNIPGAIVDSMKEKFQFNLMTRDRFEEIVVLSKTKEPVFFRAHTDEKEIVKISKAVNADIIIYGKYGYNKAEKRIMVNAFIYHRSRQKTTGTIDMNTPVTSEMFKLVDTVADSVIEHIAIIAREDAEAAKKTGETIAQEEKKGKAVDDKITLVKREMPVGKSYRLYAGGAFAGGMGFFSDILKPGAGVTVGIANDERKFWHYGASFTAIYTRGSENTDTLLFKEDINMIEYMLFMPLTIQGGISINTDFFTILQPFAGIGISIDMIKTGKEPVVLEGEPLREENTMIWYVNPVATVGLKLPIAFGNFFVSPFAQLYGYAGKTNDGLKMGLLLLAGVQCMW